MEDPNGPHPHQALLDALTAERFGRPVPEWHNDEHHNDEHHEAPEAAIRALRLITDNTKRAA